MHFFVLCISLAVLWIMLLIFFLTQVLVEMSLAMLEAVVFA